MFKTMSALMLLQGASATYSEGACPAYTSVKNLDVKQYMGQWYEIAKDKKIVYEIGAECTTAHYTLRDDGDVNVTNRARYWYYLNNYYSVKGKLRCDVSDSECRVAFFGKSVEGVANYKVLATDYDNFTLIYNCTPSGKGKNEILWLLSRENTLDATIFAKVKENMTRVLPSYDFDSRTEYSTQNKNCKYTWEAEMGSTMF